MKVAYQRCTIHGNLVAMSITALDSRGILNLRKIFGSAFSAYYFTGIVSKPITNLRNNRILYTVQDSLELKFPHIDTF